MVRGILLCQGQAVVLGALGKARLPVHAIAGGQVEDRLDEHSVVDLAEERVRKPIHEDWLDVRVEHGEERLAH